MKPTNLQKAFTEAYNRMIKDKEENKVLKSPLMYVYNAAISAVFNVLAKFTVKEKDEKGNLVLSQKDVETLYKDIEELKEK